MPIMHVPFDTIRLGDAYRIVSYPSTTISRPFEVIVITPYWNTTHAYVPKHDPDMILRSKVYHKRGFNEAQKGIYNYTQRYKWIHNTDTRYNAIVCADIDNDGIIEVLSSMSEYYAIFYPLRTVCLRATDGSVKWTFDHGSHVITTHDINNDGYYEIILCERGCGVLRVLNYNGSIMFTVYVYYVFDTIPPIVCDVDNDGNPEIVFQEYRHLKCVKNDGSVLWTIFDMFNLAFEAYIASADIDNDGYVEIVVAGNCELLIINGMDGSIKATTRYNYPNVAWCWRNHVALIDINSDDKLEILVGITVYRKVDDIYIQCGGYYAFNCKGELLWFTDLSDGITGIGLCVTDKLVVSKTATKTITACYIEDGSLAWRIYDGVWTSRNAGCVSADIDGDGRYEIIAPRHYYPYSTLTFIKDDGSIIYEIEYERYIHQMCLYDVDKDGKLEILVPVPYSIICLY